MTKPVNYLINSLAGLEGEPGVFYNYILAADGLYLRAKNHQLAATVCIAPQKIRGLAPLKEEIQLLHGKIPLYFLNLVLSILCIKPDIEQYLAVTWQENYSLNVPSQLQTAGSVTYETLPCTVLDIHSHVGGVPAYFSVIDNRDEQGLVFMPSSEISATFARQWSSSWEYMVTSCLSGRRISLYRIALAWNDKFEVSNSSRIPAIIVVGCGGTGGFVADGLARMLPSNINLILIDMDRVEEHNLNRQSFIAADVGLFKSEALAKRLAGKYQRPVQYSILPVGAADLPKGIIVGCVDNGLARQTIADRIHDGQWWVDSGNGTNFGQVLIGNSKVDKLKPSFTADLCVRLPFPTIQQPALLAQIPRQRSCAEAVAADDQSPTINQAMGALVLEVVRRIIAGSCPWMQLYLDLEAGTLTPTMAAPETVSRLTRIKFSKLIEK